MKLKLSLEREKMALEKRRFQRESDSEKRRLENDIEKLNLQLSLEREKMALEERRLENDIEKLNLQLSLERGKAGGGEASNCSVFFATITLSAAILGGSLYVSTNGWQPILRSISSLLKSFVRWLHSPFRKKLFGDSEEMVRLSDVTTGKCKYAGMIAYCSLFGLGQRRKST